MKTLLLPLLASLVSFNCGPGAEGPQGPAGPAGAQGPAGPAGADGAPGASDLYLPGAAFYPENLSAAADGTLYVGSVATGEVVAFTAGGSATTFLAAGGDVKGVAGVLADDSTSSLFVASIDPQFQAATSVKRYSLATGALIATYTFPQAAFPNDFAFDAEHRLYVTDSFSGKIYRLDALDADGVFTEWKTVAALAPQHQGAFGADGITFNGTDAFYVNNNDTGALVRVPLEGDPAEVTLTPALSHPDGQRLLADGALLVVDNAGTLNRVSLSGATGTVTPLANRLDAPSGVVESGGSLWVTEGQIPTSLLTGTPPNLPFTVRRFTAY